LHHRFATDLDAKSSISQDPAKERRTGNTLRLASSRHFTPFLVSTDSFIGEEPKTVMRKLSDRLADKWRKPYSVVSGYVNARMSIAIVRATRRYLRGSRVPNSRMSNRRLQWEARQGSVYYVIRQKAHDDSISLVHYFFFLASRNSVLINQTPIQPMDTTGPDSSK
jgi:hypothetical protein